MLESRTGASATDVEVLQMRCWQEKEADVRELCCCCAVSGDCDALHVVAVLFQVTVMHSMLLLCCFR